LLLPKKTNQVLISYNRPSAALVLSSKFNTQITKKTCPGDKSTNPEYPGGHFSAIGAENAKI
jgi:hypothetical protein